MYVKIAIVGRPNVGKSTLFNKMVKKNSSIVFDTPGVTRDRIEAVTDFFDMKLKLIDTAGFDNTKSDEISQEMIKQNIKAIEDAEIILFLVDAKDGINQLDTSFAEVLRKFNKEVILVCNKTEKKPQDDIMGEIYQLGFKNMVFVSAEHKIGLEKLADQLKKSYLNKYNIDLGEMAKLDTESDAYIEKTDRLSIAIVGRPNAGKSTIFNKILNDERSIVSEVAGTTRDSIHQEIEYGGKKIDLVDTAGIRKRLKVDDRIEEFSVESAFYSIKFSTVAILCMDAKNAFESQDLRIAKFAIDEGRGLVIVMNKWDLLTEKEREKIIDGMEKFLQNVFPKTRGLPFFTISGKFDENINEILDECVVLNDIWSKRINTAKLNAFLREVSQNSPAPRCKGHEVKVKYATQISTRPMTLCIFTNMIEGITDSYQNFLENEIRNKFGIFGVPIRFKIKKSDNPFKPVARPKLRTPQVTKRFANVVKKNKKKT
ncbi:ribosome biogenesis GTPase Der [Candidatus Deianiraea vastatrix]|nr:ribosome biogenesis GTPase Der [Candidatus Deianiraea vastatrix]